LKRGKFFAKIWIDNFVLMNDNELAITPFQSAVSGTVRLPGSKSITARALVLAALCAGPVRLKNVLFSDDTVGMMNCLEQLGFQVDRDEANLTVTVYGQGGDIPHSTAEVNVGNGGTVARFIPALLALKKGGSYKLTAGEAMTKRPMSPLLGALESAGAISVTYDGEVGYYPFSIQTNGLPGGKLKIDASRSGQFVSALMLVAPLAEGPLSIQLAGEAVSKPFITLTEKMIHEFGYSSQISSSDNVYDFSGNGHYSFKGGEYAIEPDATAASYFIALVLLVGGRIIFPGMSSRMKQGDAAFVNLIKSLGLEVKMSEDSWVVQQKIQTAMIGMEHNFSEISDTFLTFAAIAPLLKGYSCITGIGHTRHQECDRVKCVAQELRKLGQEVHETEATLEIHPKPLQPAVIDPHGDHRIAMSFAVLGSYNFNGDGSSWITIKDPGCCSKTFPKFFDILENLRIQ